MPDSSPPRWLTAAQAAPYCGFPSTNALYLERSRTGEPIAVRTGPRRLRFLQEDLDAWLLKRREHTALAATSDSHEGVA